MRVLRWWWGSSAHRSNSRLLNTEGKPTGFVVSFLRSFQITGHTAKNRIGNVLDASYDPSLGKVEPQHYHCIFRWMCGSKQPKETLGFFCLKDKEPWETFQETVPTNMVGMTCRFRTCYTFAWLWLARCSTELPLEDDCQEDCGLNALQMKATKDSVFPEETGRLTRVYRGIFIWSYGTISP